MARVNWKKYITIDAAIHHGEPCISGTRISVAIIVGSLADGMTAKEVLEAYPQLSATDIQAALAYAADVMRQELLLPFKG
jgi:uncharacterized protein (DUF433 family)